MRTVIYSNTVIEKLQILKDLLTDEYGKKKSDTIIKNIAGKLDNLGMFNSGEYVKDRFGIDCDYMYLYIEPNFYFYKECSDKIDIIEMFHEKEDFIYVLFGIPMRSKESIDYWGE